MTYKQHLKEIREKYPDLNFKEAQKLASQSYKDAQEEPKEKPKKATSNKELSIHPEFIFKDKKLMAYERGKENLNCIDRYFYNPETEKVYYSSFYIKKEGMNNFRCADVGGILLEVIYHDENLPTVSKDILKKFDQETQQKLESMKPIYINPICSDEKI